MHALNLLQRSRRAWHHGLRLALLNGVLAVLCAASFMGTLYAVTRLSDWRIAAQGGDPRAAVPFPYPVLLLLYALLFPAAWVWFGRRLAGARAERLRAAVIGALPLFGLSGLGYAAAAGTLLLGDFNANGMLAATLFVYGLIATLILLAGLVCVGTITLMKGVRDGQTEPQMNAD